MKDVEEKKEWMWWEVVTKLASVATTATWTRLGHAFGSDDHLQL